MLSELEGRSDIFAIEVQDTINVESTMAAMQQLARYLAVGDIEATS
jgi:hypothetical protein